MLLTRTITIPVTSTEAPAFTVTGPTPEGLTIFLENLDTVNYVSYRIQVGNANISSAYSDLPSDTASPPASVSGNYNCSGTLTPVSPSVNTNRVMISVRTTYPYLQLLASSSGGVSMNVGLVTIGPNTSVNFTNGQL